MKASKNLTRHQKCSKSYKISCHNSPLFYFKNFDIMFKKIFYIVDRDLIQC